MIRSTLTYPAIKHRLADTTGASIVIALIFFLICAVVGSTVLTAASVNAQATASYRDVRRAEYTVSSAAAVLADSLQRDVRLEWDWSQASASSGPVIGEWAGEYPALFILVWERVAPDLWRYDSVAGIWKPHEVTLSDLQITGVADMDTVYANITVDNDFRVTIRLSLDNDPDTAGPYDETVSLQARPEYADDKLVALTWENPIITKTGGR